jgi:DNA polymerase-1
VDINYSSVPLRYVERHIDFDKPVFFDTEGYEITLAQFKQEHWAEALVVEFPNREQLQELVSKMHSVIYVSSYDLGILGIAPERMDDLYFASKTAFPLLDGHGLDEVAAPFYLHINKKDLQNSFTSKKQAKEFTEEQLEYAATDVYALEWLWKQPAIQAVLRTNLAYKIDIKNQRLALSWEHNGMPVIKEAYDATVAATEARRAEWQGKLNASTGIELNVKSYKQKREYFNIEKTDAPTFKRMFLEEGNLEAEMVLEVTKARTDLSNLKKYAESYYPNEDPIRIRTCMNVAGAITGRYSSKGFKNRVGYDNTQNITRAFKPIFGYPEGSGRKIISADYGTAEMLGVCAIYNVPTLRELIKAGEDLHYAMAAVMTGKPIDRITKDERQAAKAVNFGLAFGMGIDRFIEYAYDTYGVKFTQIEAKRAKRLYYKAHPGIEVHHKKTAKNIENAKKGKTGPVLVRTAMGRIVKPKQYTDALNIPVQGSIAEATKMAMNFLVEDYPDIMSKGMIINMVHDSVILDFPEEYAEEAAKALKESMLLGWKEMSKSSLFVYHDLPIKVDVDIANTFK